MLKAKRNKINEQEKEKKPANEMNDINEQGNEHVDHSKTIREFINLFKPEIFLSRFTTIFNLIYFPLQIVNKHSNNCFNF
jgi:predicted transcriptional regulator